MRFIDSAYDLGIIKKWHIQQYTYGINKIIKCALLECDPLLFV